MKRDIRKFKSRKNRKRALHLRQLKNETPKVESSSTPNPIVSAIGKYFSNRQGDR
jgi:hypothetical protein